MSTQSFTMHPSTKHNHRAVEFFVDSDGYPIKFRIQPGLEASLKQHLEESITLHGGIVIGKIPIQGLVVVDPESHVGRSLVSDWSWKERPGRRFVPYSFILRCVSEKCLLSIDRHALNPGHHIQHMFDSDTQRDLPQNVKDKLALFLATALPDSLGKRSSNRLYKKLVKNKTRYPWIGDYDWRVLRNHYCRNKKYYDKLVSLIIKKRASEKADKPWSPSMPAARKQVLIVKKTDNDAKPSNIEVVLPSLKSVPTMGQGRKRVKFDKPFLIERKRKFGNDITNEKTEKRPRTIDDMLKAPLPPIVTERRRPQRLPKLAISSVPPAEDITEIEIGRPALKDVSGGIWIDGDFKGDGRIPSEKKNTMHPPGFRANDRFSESLIFYDMGFDDLRLSASLDLMANNSDADVIDEVTVLEILELPTAPATAREITIKPLEEATEPSHTGPARSHPGNGEAPEALAVLELAESTRFTVEEIKQKLDGFSGHMAKTRDFFMRCRRLVDDLYISTSIAERSRGDAEKHKSGKLG